MLLVQANYALPSDADFHSLTYGPLAGMTYDERLAVAHRHGKLALLPGKAGGAVCTRCGREGHWSSHCDSA